MFDRQSIKNFLNSKIDRVQDIWAEANGNAPIYRK
jgi:hypothetical protein